MELAQSLFLNEEAFAQIPEQKKPVFLYEWLRFLDRVLGEVQRSDIKSAQSRLLTQLLQQMSLGPGPPTRKLIAKCLGTLFSIGDTSNLFSTINSCNDILRNKDDSPSYLPTKLAAVICIGSIYERLGRMVGRSFEDTAQILLRALKNAESQARTEIMTTLSKMVTGLGSAGTSIHKDVYKSAKSCLLDRVMSVRSASTECLIALAREGVFLSANDAEMVISTCLKALEGSTFSVRLAIAKLLGEVLAVAHQPARFLKGVQSPQIMAQYAARSLALGDCLQMLAVSFIRGGSGFLKGSSVGGAVNIARETRAGIAYAYISFVKKLGSTWLERCLPVFIRHVLDLCGHLKQLNISESLYYRRCVAVILRSTVGRILNEKVQHSACREIGCVIAEQISCIDMSIDSSLDRSISADQQANQHILISALEELSCLVEQLSTMVTPLFTEASGIMEPVFAVLLHPSVQVRIFGAWCLRSIGTALPSLLAPLIDRCLSRLEHLKNSADALSGYSLALAALMAGSYRSFLGIPASKGKQVFAVAEELLRTAAQTSRLTLPKTQAGWILLAGLMTLGSDMVRPHLPKLLMLWRNAFPRSEKEAETEKNRGDGFTWQVTFESRASALGAMEAFLSNCPDLITDDVIRRLLVPIDAGLTMFAHAPQIIAENGTHLRPLASTARMRLYDTLSRLKPASFDGCFAQLLRELVADFTLTDKPGATTTSLLHHMCHRDENIILGASYYDADQAWIEEVLQEPNATFSGEFGVGTLENNLYALLSRPDPHVVFAPAPLPLSVAVVDAGIQLYGLIFPLVPSKHRLQILDHFADCIKQAKGARQMAIQINILTAFLCSLKHQAEEKVGFDSDAVRTAAINLVVGSLSSNNAQLRCASAEALGRVAQVVADPPFVAGLAQSCFDRLQGCRDMVNRTGFSLALGCLHRYVGGLGSGHHLNTSIGVLLGLAQDLSSPIVQLWAIHALGLIADSGGPMFRGYVEPSLALSLKLLLTAAANHIDVHRCIGKLISSLITTVGPELQSNLGNSVTTRSNFQAACAILSGHSDPIVQAEAVSCLQQLHIFAPRHVNLGSLVPQLCRLIRSPYLIVRKAALSCMRQLAQKESEELREHTQSLVPKGIEPKSAASSQEDQDSVLPDTGLEGALFAMLDIETDSQLRENVKETLLSLAQRLCSTNLYHWVTLCKVILATVATDLQSVHQEEKVVRITESTDDDVQEDEALQFGVSGLHSHKQAVMPRWRTRVFAMDLVRKIIVFCGPERAHFDLALAKELQYGNSEIDYLVLHLSDLVRMAFMAATSDSTDLRSAGLAALQDVISRFAAVPEPEFPGHVILEQFQAQVGAALRPAFAAETPSNVTAAACEVCSTWIGSGVARDLNDLRRVHQLLVSSLAKLKSGSVSTQLYSESAAALEKLAVLKAWAEVYIVAMNRAAQTGINPADKFGTADKLDKQSDTLLDLVQPELEVLVTEWLAALKNLALVSLPPELMSHAPSQLATGVLALSDTQRSCPAILLAAATWLRSNNFETSSDEKADSNSKPGDDQAEDEGIQKTNVNRLFLILGICIEALCNPKVQEESDIQLYLQTVCSIIDCPFSREELLTDPKVPIEVLNIMHRIILTNDSIRCQLLCMNVLDKVIDAAAAAAVTTERNQEEEATNNNNEPKAKLSDFRLTPSGVDINPGKSLVFAALEVCLCALVRHIPDLYPGAMRTKRTVAAGHHHRPATMLPADAQQLIVRSLNAMTRLPALCSTTGVINTLPVILFLQTGIVREMSKVDKSAANLDLTVGQISMVTATGLQCLKTLVSRPYYMKISSGGTEVASKKLNPDWVKIIQSALWTVLQWAENPRSDKIDDVVIILAVAVFLISAPRVVYFTPKIREVIFQLFKDSLNNPLTVVQYKCLQSLQSIFMVKDRNVALHFIQALGPSILRMIKSRIPSQSEDSPASESPECVKDTEPQNSQHEASTTFAWSENEVPVFSENLKAIEAMILALPEDKRLWMLGYTTDMLIDLIEFGGTLTVEMNASQRKVFEAIKTEAVQRITKWSALFRIHFQGVLSSSPETKRRLEAIFQEIASQQQKLGGTSSAGKLISAKPSSKSEVNPSIKLTMDFSSFAAK